MTLTRQIRLHLAESEFGGSGDLTKLLGIEYDHTIADTYGYFYTTGRGERAVELNTIRVARKARKGTGTKIMDALCDAADREGLIITLSLGSKGDFKGNSGWKSTSSTSRLDKWYRSFGFVSNSKKGRFDLRGQRHRLPLLRESKAEVEHGLSKKGFPQDFDGVSLGRDKDGWFVYTHRCRSDSYESAEKIPQSKIDYISSTG